ncbi:MAG: hypothetical protein A3H28_03015 [Acidobacteria bacterium RIFCSPLOWO2_02_FULL_61_28]|nr:MAG: hypothetical protein A3H28_03015 [Acidobacteria bacterium RIFCSPLOWO2_02_FULL_61_28]
MVDEVGDAPLLTKDAAAHLARSLKREISETELLQIARSGELRLSVHLPPSVLGEPESVPPAEYQRAFPGGPIRVEGVWDVVMDAAAQFSIDLRLREIQRIPPTRMPKLDYPRFERPGIRCRLFPIKRAGVWPDGSYFVVHKSSLT